MPVRRSHAAAVENTGCCGDGPCSPVQKDGILSREGRAGMIAAESGVGVCAEDRRLEHFLRICGWAGSPAAGQSGRRPQENVIRDGWIRSAR